MSYGNDNGLVKVIWSVFGVLAIVVTAGMYGCPRYSVYSQRLEGEALLAHSQAAKEVAVSEARAKMESAGLLASAEVARAEGVAKANQIIGESLKSNEAYLRYLWITEVAGANIDKTVVYIPTEANMPIMEAGRNVSHGVQPQTPVKVEK